MAHVLIIGGGPAGCSAALTLRLRGADVTLLCAAGGALEKAKRVDNYPGLPEMAGADMLAAFRAQAEQAGVKLAHGLARYIQKTRKGFTVLAGEDMIACDAVLLATGVSRVARIEGEDALVGRGVSYCATCDGMLYRGRPVAVVAQDAGFAEDVAFLTSICPVDYYMEKPHEAPAGVTLRDGQPTALREAGEQIALTANGEERLYDCVFILRPAVALTSLLPHLAMNGEAVAVDEAMATSVPGVFAAGDVTGAPYQAARAVGQGNTAALAIAKYLHEKEMNN
ncbi:MAG: NAD(P)/FAD-dependent oxidoreductase [Clostridia bacterium]|nr:NAD(P)/FAD-dependent oxidoreductase [Clostridia bacterium]